MLGTDYTDFVVLINQNRVICVIRA